MTDSGHEYGVARPHKTHRQLYPDQYTHQLCGQRVRFANGDGGGVVERVFLTKFGLLATFVGSDAKTAYAITDLVVEGSALRVGDRVRFAEPSPGEAAERFTVLELRGERVLVELICDWPIPPTHAYLLTELVLDTTTNEQEN